jgi:hypothetical protein
MRARADLWQIRADIEREKLRMVAPYPFFGRPMRFQDDYAALQITDDGRFSFSEVSLEPVTSVEAGDSDATNSRSRALPQDVKHIVTYEGVFTAPHVLAADEDDPQGTLRARSPGTSEKRQKPAEAKEQTLGSKSKEANLEEQLQTPPPEIAAIEATGLVRHQIVEAGAKWRLANVDRGEFRFVITVCPFFHPVYATVKVLVRRSPNHPQPRSRRLPFVEPPYAVANITNKRSSKSVGLGAHSGMSRKGGSVGGLRPKVDGSPFRQAGAGSLASPHSMCGRSGRQRDLQSSYSLPNLQKSSPEVSWIL